MTKPTGNPRGQPRKKAVAENRTIRIRPDIDHRVRDYQQARGLKNYSVAVNDLLRRSLGAVAAGTPGDNPPPELRRMKNVRHRK